MFGYVKVSFAPQVLKRDEGRAPQGLEIGKKHPLKLFSIILDPTLNREVQMIQIYFFPSFKKQK